MDGDDIAVFDSQLQIPEAWDGEIVHPAPPPSARSRRRKTAEPVSQEEAGVLTPPAMPEAVDVDVEPEVIDVDVEPEVVDVDVESEVVDVDVEPEIENLEDPEEPV